MNNILQYCSEQELKEHGNGATFNIENLGFFQMGFFNVRMGFIAWSIPLGRSLRTAGPVQIWNDGQECYSWIESRGWWVFKRKIHILVRIDENGSIRCTHRKLLPYWNPFTTEEVVSHLD